MHHRDNGYDSWSVHVRDPVLSDMMNLSVMKSLISPPNAIEAAVRRFEKFTNSLGHKAGQYPASNRLVEKWMDHLIFNEFASTEKVMQLLEQLCDHHTSYGLDQAWTQLIASREILSRLEFLEEHFNDPVVYYSRLAPFKQWGTGTDGNMIQSTTYREFLKHQMNRCYHKLISLNDVHDSVELLGSYAHQNKIDWPHSLQFEKVLMDSITFPQNRIPAHPSTYRSKPSSSPTSANYDRRSALPGDRRPRNHPQQSTSQFGSNVSFVDNRTYAPKPTQSARNSIVLPPLTPSRVQPAKALDAFSNRQVADIDKQFFSALVNSARKRQFSDLTFIPSEEFGSEERVIKQRLLDIV
jgi:hypothetical protein